MIRLEVNGNVESSGESSEFKCMGIYDVLFIKIYDDYCLWDPRSLLPTNYIIVAFGCHHLKHAASLVDVLLGPLVTSCKCSLGNSCVRISHVYVGLFPFLSHPQCTL